jgi:hypothetical protein
MTSPCRPEGVQSENNHGRESYDGRLQNNLPCYHIIYHIISDTIVESTSTGTYSKLA